MDCRNTLRCLFTIGLVLALVSPAFTQVKKALDNVDALRRPKPKIYLLDAGDVLGVFIEGVLGKAGEAPPVQFPKAGSGLPPSVGYPVVVRENGMVSLPLLEPISVKGLSVAQAEKRIKSVYLGDNKLGKKIIKEDNRVIVTLQRMRTVSVTVIREDNSQSMGLGGNVNRAPVTQRSDGSAVATTIQLPVGDNDLFNALIQTGGMPGVNAQPYATIYRAPAPNGQSSAGTVHFPRSSGYSSAPAPICPPSTNVYRTPSQSQLKRAYDPSLSSGDIVVVQAKPTEVYYTSGLMASAERPLPRDKPLDVLQVVAISGGPIAHTINQFGFSSLPPTELVIVRNNPRTGQVNIRVDLNQAVVDPYQRIQVQPGDHLILQYKPVQRIGNFGIDAVNSYGLRRLFQ